MVVNMNLKELAKNGFRTKEISVAEWDGVTIIIREPMHAKFNHYMKEIKNITENDALSEYEKDNAFIKAEAKFFITVFFDADNNQVFTESDIDELCKTYGPIHTRLLNQAIELIGLGKDPIQEAEKK